MATRSRSTFEKRQKEMKRMEKQRMKAAQRAERNLAKRLAHQANLAPQSDNEVAPAE